MGQQRLLWPSLFILYDLREVRVTNILGGHVQTLLVSTLIVAVLSCSALSHHCVPQP